MHADKRLRATPVDCEDGLMLLLSASTLLHDLIIVIEEWV